MSVTNRGLRVESRREARVASGEVRAMASGERRVGSGEGRTRRDVLRACSGGGPSTHDARGRSRGMSLTEVLIAMGILTVGLLSVASVFPVGSFYMQKAEIADRGSAIAQSVMSDIITRGMLNPRSWYVINPVPAGVAGTWDATFPSDGKYAPSQVSGTFSRPFALSLGEALAQPTAATDRTLLGKQFGNAYVIDPIGVSIMALAKQPPFVSKVVHGPAAVFPAAAYNAFQTYIGNQGWSNSVPWSPWFGGTSTSYSGYEWPVRRVTFRQPTTGWQMDASTANHFFRGNDDLTVDLPARDDRPATQTWEKWTDSSGNTYPLSRQWNGDYSWIVTVVPTTNDARNAMATNPEGFEYNVSVVVFYKRVLPDTADVNANLYATNNNLYWSAMSQSERAVQATVVSTGLNGGELLLTDFGDSYDAANPGVPKYTAFDDLRSGNWIMLCGPHPNSSTNEPRFVLNWYQVLSIDKEGTGIAGFDPNKQRVVAVRGPQWPWQPAASFATSDASNDLCVAICKGAVAVHSKTMRLESGMGSASGGSDVSFSSSGTPSETPPPYH